MKGKSGKSDATDAAAICEAAPAAGIGVGRLRDSPVEPVPRARFVLGSVRPTPHIQGVDVQSLPCERHARLHLESPAAQPPKEPTMSALSRLPGLSVTAALCCALAAPAAYAETFAFTQGGFTEGGEITGMFVGSDLDSDGQINSFLGEVTAFSLRFSGNAVIPAFTHTFSALSGLVYDVGSGFIGNGPNGAVEGLASNWFGIDGYDYASGLGPTGTAGGRIISIATGVTSSTEQLIAVSVVPEPGTVALFALGLAFMAGRRRASRWV
jgi:hypothetical protein